MGQLVVQDQKDQNLILGGVVVWVWFFESDVLFVHQKRDAFSLSLYPRSHKSNTSSPVEKIQHICAT